jgi:hypothetical protein
MIKYILPLLIIYFLYIYDKPLIVSDNNHIKFLIEKNVLILLVSILSLTIITSLPHNTSLSNKTPSNSPIENMIFIVMIIAINLVLWVRIIKFQHYSIQANNLANSEQFISSVANGRDYSYITNDAKQQFEADFMTECYEKKLLIPGFEPIVKDEDVKAEDSEIRATTLDLALNSDNMFSVQQKENKCIIANYIPNDLSLISSNDTDGMKDFYNCEYNTDISTINSN